MMPRRAVAASPSVQLENPRTAVEGGVMNRVWLGALLGVTYAPILGTGVLFGAVSGWAVGRWAAAEWSSRLFTRLALHATVGGAV